jgi:predicted nucleic-acid-binding protein
MTGLDTSVRVRHLTQDDPRQAREANAMVLDRILATAQFDIDQRDVVRRALEDYRAGKGDFADYVIGNHNRESGCPTTATFDRRLKDSALFRVLVA